MSSVVETISSESSTPETIVYEVKKEIKPLPTCDDKLLIEKTKEFISSYYNKNIDNSVVARRKKHFVLAGLNNFSKEILEELFKCDKNGCLLITESYLEYEVNRFFFEKISKETTIDCT